MRLETFLRTEAGKLLMLTALSLPLLQIAMPNVALAEYGIVQTADMPTFEIKITEDKLSSLINSDTEGSNTASEPDPIALRKQMLDKYFTEGRSSPKFAASTQTLAEQPHWRKIISIAFVESTLGKHCYYNNCWGISPGGRLAKYATLDAGILAHNDLIERRYNGWAYERMNGVYVVPKNPRWVRGAYQIEAELDALEKELFSPVSDTQIASK